MLGVIREVVRILLVLTLIKQLFSIILRQKFLIQNI